MGIGNCVLKCLFHWRYFFCPIRTCAWLNILGIGVVLANNVPLKWFLNIGDSVGISERNYCHIYYVKLPNNMNTVQRKTSNDYYLSRQEI